MSLFILSHIALPWMSFVNGGPPARRSDLSEFRPIIRHSPPVRLRTRGHGATFTQEHPSKPAQGSFSATRPQDLREIQTFPLNMTAFIKILEEGRRPSRFRSVHWLIIG